MKILLITNKSPWPPKDGGSSATCSTISALTLNGVSVSVLALNTSKHHVHPDIIPHGFRDNTRLVSIDTRIKPLKLIQNMLFSEKPYTIQRFQSEEFGEMIIKMTGQGFDIIQIEGLAMTKYLPLLRSLTDSAILFRPHNVENIIWKNLAEETGNPLIKAYLRNLSKRTEKYEKEVMNRFDGLLAITENDLQWYKNSGLRIPCITAFPGLPEYEAVRVETIPGSVCFLGALDWKPNIYGLEWFINHVWRRVVDAIPGASLHIAGRNPSRRAVKLAGAVNTKFYGEIDSPAEFIADKEILISPLFSGSGIRMKILEGMNMGRCIVATSAAAEGLICENGSNIFLSDDPEEFSRKIINLLGNERKRNEAGLMALENVRKNYDILASAENMLNFYSRFTG